MKILFNNNILSNSQKISYKGLENFKFNPFRTSNYDVFIRSDKKDEEYHGDFDENAFRMNFGPAGDLVSEEYKNFWKVNFAMAFYFRNFQDLILKALKEGRSLKRCSDFCIHNTYSEKTAQTLEKFLTSAGIINDREKLTKISGIYMSLAGKNEPYFETKGLNLLYAYLSLDEPKEILNYPYIIMEATELNLQHNKDFDLNKIVEFIKELGAKNENALFKKFSYLAKDFNNFRDFDDKFAGFMHILNLFSAKEKGLNKLIKENEDLNTISATELYSQYCEIIDYLYEKDPKNWLEEFREILKQTQGHEKFSKTTMNAVKDYTDLSTVEGKIEFLELIKSEDLTTEDVNELVSVRNLYTTSNEMGFILNKNRIVANLTTLDDFDEESANEFYKNFKQALNAIYDENNSKQEHDLQTFAKILKQFNLKNDDEFFNFYHSLTKKQTKQNKKPQTHKKATLQEVRDFIYLFNFIGDDNLQKYKKDKNYPLISELQKKKEHFEKVKTTIEEELNKKGAIVQKNTALKTYTKYGETLKKYPYIPTFIEKILAQNARDFIEFDEEKELKAKFLAYFKNEQMLNAFLAKNEIEITSSKEDRSFCELYLRILGLILDDKNEKEQEKYLQKILNSDFFKNSKSGIINFTKRRKEEDLKIIFEIIVNEGISSIAQINTILNRYANKDKEISNFLNYCKNQELNFSDFIRKIEQLQKELENSGINIKINNDNISRINLENYNFGKISDSKLAQLAKELFGVDDKLNFICGLNATFIESDEQIITAHIIAKEILRSIGGRYENEYKNLMRCLGIKQELNSATNLNYIESLIPKDLIDFLNSNEIFDFRENPTNHLNISYHAKLRLLERFILDEYNLEDLNTDKVKDEIKEVLKAVYTKTPVKIYKGSTKEENRFITITEYKNGAIKTIFNTNGNIGSIVKI